MYVRLLLRRKKEEKKITAKRKENSFSFHLRFKSFYVSTLGVFYYGKFRVIDLDIVASCGTREKRKKNCNSMPLDFFFFLSSFFFIPPSQTIKCFFVCNFSFICQHSFCFPGVKFFCCCCVKKKHTLKS